MKFPISRRKQEHIEKVATFQERLENINGLTDPAEKVLLLRELKKEVYGHFYPHIDKSHMVALAVGFPAGCLSLVLIGVGPVGWAIGGVCGLIAGSAYTRMQTYEKAQDAICGAADTAINEIVEKGDLAQLAASPLLGDAMRHFPVLKERFNEAANMQNFQKMLSVQPQVQPQPQPPSRAPAVVTTTPVKVSKPLTFNNKGGQNSQNGFRF